MRLLRLNNLMIYVCLSVVFRTNREFSPIAGERLQILQIFPMLGTHGH